MLLPEGRVISLRSRSLVGSLPLRRLRSWRAALCAVAVLSAALLCAPPAPAQGGVDETGTGGRHTIQGRIFFQSGQRIDTRLKVRLESPTFGDLSVMADMNGSFAFRSLESGSYTVVVEGGDNFETARERVYIESDGGNTRRGLSGLPAFTRPYTVQIYLQPKRQNGLEGRPGVLNAALASVPKPAAELYQKAIESVRRGEGDKAVTQLKSAIEVYPNFPLALSELGVQYLKLKQPDKAAEVLKASLKLAPDDYATLLSYGIALYEQRDFAGAETQLRHALKKNHASPSAHLYLGLALIGRRDLDAAEKELQQAVASGGDQMALAHYYLGGLYWGRRDYRRAADELETYLRLTPNAPDAARVRSTIKELRGK